MAMFVFDDSCFRYRMYLLLVHLLVYDVAFVPWPLRSNRDKMNILHLLKGDGGGVGDWPASGTTRASCVGRGWFLFPVAARGRADL